MEFISAEEFQKQPKEVQKVFMEWWKPSVGDLFMIEKTTSFKGDKHNFIECFLTGFEVADLTEIERKRIICPLFTEGQIRKFIEDKGYFISNDIIFKSYTLFDAKKYKCCKVGEQREDTILKTYWKVALEIAKESVENE